MMKSKLRELKKRSKDELKKSGAIRPLLSDQKKAHPICAIESQLYIESKKMYEDALIHEKLIALYSHQEIQPFFNLIGLAALGHHKSAQNNLSKKKNFKIFVVDSMESIMESICNKKYGGFYSLKQSVFVGKAAGNKHVLSFMLHEAMHFAINEVFNNQSKPYRVDGEQRETQHMIEKTKSRLKKIPRNEFNDFLAWTLNNVFEKYDESDYGCELAVKVIEICALVGYEEGAAWLKEHVPELWDFHINTINPAIESYLTEQDYTKFIDTNIKLEPENKKDPFFDSFSSSKNEMNSLVFAFFCIIGIIAIPTTMILSGAATVLSMMNNLILYCQTSMQPKKDINLAGTTEKDSYSEDHAPQDQAPRV